MSSTRSCQEQAFKAAPTARTQLAPQGPLPAVHVFTVTQPVPTHITLEFNPSCRLRTSTMWKLSPFYGQPLTNQSQQEMLEFHMPSTTSICVGRKPTPTIRMSNHEACNRRRWRASRFRCCFVSSLIWSFNTLRCSCKTRELHAIPA